MKGIREYNSIPIRLTMVLYHRHSVYSVYLQTMAWNHLYHD